MNKERTARASALLGIALMTTLAALSGCQSNSSADLSAAQTRTAYGPGNLSQCGFNQQLSTRPSMVFFTDGLASLDAQAGRAPGFLPDDWEYGRNDRSLPVGRQRVSQTYVDHYYQVTYDRIYNWSGQVHTSSETYTRSIRVGERRH